MSLEAQEKQDSLAHSKVIHVPAQKASQIHLFCIATTEIEVCPKELCISTRSNH